MSVSTRVFDALCRGMTHMVFTAEGGGLTVVSPLGTNGDFSSLRGTVTFMQQTYPLNNFNEGDVVTLPGCVGMERVTIERISMSGVTVNGTSFGPHTVLAGSSPAILLESAKPRHVKGAELLEVTPGAELLETPVNGADLLELPAGAELLDLPTSEEPPPGWELLGDQSPPGSDLLS